MTTRPRQPVPQTTRLSDNLSLGQFLSGLVTDDASAALVVLGGQARGPSKQGTLTFNPNLTVRFTLVVTVMAASAIDDCTAGATRCVSLLKSDGRIWPWFGFGLAGWLALPELPDAESLPPHFNQFIFISANLRRTRILEWISDLILKSHGKQNSAAADNNDGMKKARSWYFFSAGNERKTLFDDKPLLKCWRRAFRTTDKNSSDKRSEELWNPYKTFIIWFTTKKLAVFYCCSIKELIDG